MGAPARVLYCDCKHADIVAPDVKRAVVRGLRRAAVAFDTISDLCGLCARKDPALRRLAAADDLRIAACTPRAVKWLFHAAGAPLSDRVRLFNLREQSADEIVAGLLPGLPATGARPISGAPVAAAADGDAWIPWFPVIDYDRCQNCKQCLSFCLFGVYALDGAGRVEVRHPDHCKTGCPACARVCPSVALMFPKYGKRPINGAEVRAEDLAQEPVNIDVAGLLRGDIHATLRARRARAPQAHPTAAFPIAPPADPRDLRGMQAELDIPDSVLESLTPDAGCGCDCPRDSDGKCAPEAPCDCDCGGPSPCGGPRDS